MKLSAGAQFGPYLVVESLGSGGMGDVYRARDTRLPRDVALKLLRGTAADVPERVRRFQQEARAASSLNHPNIVVVYEAGEASPAEGERPVPFLAMELVAGEPLGYSARTRGLSVRAVLDLATQIADGLARAHESGIVHRDLKPGNLLVTPDGLVKIVDFGLAKLHPSESLSAANSRADTETSPGGVLGTPEYMSPEQARGEDAEFPSDQFSFGCVVYELLTGRRPFAGASAGETTSAILRDEPIPIDEVRPGVPAPLRWIVERCLSKAARDRYGSSRDLARDLRTLREHLGDLGGPITTPVVPSPRRSRNLVTLLALGLLVTLTAAISLYVSAKLKAPVEPEFRRMTFQQGTVFRALFVPRSAAILHTASWNGTPARTFTMLPEASGLDRTLEAAMQLPMAFSEDGAELLVLLGTSRPSLNARGTLAVWPAGGGKARPIVDDAGWGDWAGGGRLVVFVRDLGAEHVLVRRELGQERILFRTTGALTYVRLSPDRTQVAFIHHGSRGNDAGQVRLLRLDGFGEARALTPVFETCLGLDWNGRTNEIWFTASSAPHRGTTLLAVDGSGHQRTLHNLPEPAILESVSSDGRCLLNLRDDRMTLAVRQGRAPARDLTWLGMSLAADVSPDGGTVLFWDGGASEKSSGAWVRPLDGSDAVRLGEGEPHRFSADGRSLVAVSRTADGGTRFVLIPVGAGPNRSVAPPDADSASPSFAGSDSLLFTRHVAGRQQVWRIQVDGTKATPLGLSDCNEPVANPSADSFLAICGENDSTIEIHSMNGPEGRRLFELPGDDAFIYVRWNERGDRIFGVTKRRRMITLEAASGELVEEDHLPPLGKGEEGDILDGAGLSADGLVQAYSAKRSSSRLYLAEGLR